MVSRKITVMRWLAAFAVIAVAGVAWHYVGRGEKIDSSASSDSPESLATVSPTDSSQQVSEATPIEHPIEQAPAISEASLDPDPSLPSLFDSDSTVMQSLAELIGADQLSLILPQALIQRTVATIDNLPRQKLARHLLPIKTASSEIIISDVEGKIFLDTKNASRYSRYMQLVESADMQSVATLYIRYYPLFQKAYREQGVADKYFNDRLIQVIDHLLATPQVKQPIELVRAEKGYDFADSKLQQRSVGQRALIRIGNENARIIKTKLSQLRAAITAAPPSAPESPAVEIPSQ